MHSQGGSVCVTVEKVTKEKLSGLFKDEIYFSIIVYLDTFNLVVRTGN